MKNITLILLGLFVAGCTSTSKYETIADSTVISQTYVEPSQPLKKYIYSIIVVSTPALAPIDSNDIDKGFHFSFEKYATISFIDSAYTSDNEAESRLLDFEVDAWREIVPERTKVFQSKALIFMPEKANEECKITFKKAYTFNTYKEAKTSYDNFEFDTEKYTTEN